jgi:hypothetical protein
MKQLLAFRTVDQFALGTFSSWYSLTINRHLSMWSTCTVRLLKRDIRLSRYHWLRIKGVTEITQLSMIQCIYSCFISDTFYKVVRGKLLLKYMRNNGDNFPWAEHRLTIIQVPWCSTYILWVSVTDDNFVEESVLYSPIWSVSNTFILQSKFQYVHCMIG